MRPIVICLSSALAAAALAAPAVAASSDYYLKLGDIKPVLSGVEGGEAAAASGAMRGKEKWIELESYSFGATRKGWDGTIKGVSSAAKFGAVGGAHRDDGVAGGAGGAGGGGATGKVSMQDMNVTMSAASPRDSASGQATGKRQHGSLPQPLSSGSVTLAGSFPGCTVGAAFADAELQVADGRYHLTDVQITSCPTAASPGGSGATESLSLNYTKVEVRGWDAKEKKE